MRRPVRWLVALLSASALALVVATRGFDDARSTLVAKNIPAVGGAVGLSVANREAATAVRYDLIFLDVVMPGIDGYETCSRLKAIHASRIAMLTSLSAPADYQRGRQAGCDYYITKPPNESDLRTILSISSFRKLTTLK